MFLASLVPGLHVLIDIRILRMLRAFRILKLTEYVHEYASLGEAFYASRRKIFVFLSHRPTDQPWTGRGQRRHATRLGNFGGTHRHRDSRDDAAPSISIERVAAVSGLRWCGANRERPLLRPVRCEPRGASCPG